MYKCLSALSIAIIFAWLQLPMPANANINTATIVASGASSSCADYKIVGICYWLRCSFWGCRIRTSTKVSHFIPEMVVSVYNHDNQSPWTEMRFINKGIMGGQYQTPNKMYSQFKFKNAEAIGHPGGAVLKMINQLGFSCASQTNSFQPYFLSSLDFLAWRFSTPEMFYFQSITPSVREVRKEGDVWGNIYPRSGSITQSHDYKASAVIAQRVADIVSQTGQLHIYISAARSGGKGKWYPKEVKEGDSKTHKWQLLSPKYEQSCAVFPSGSVTNTYSDKLSTTENYSWSLWRPYACCKQQGQTFLGSTDWASSHTQ